ncbi:MAG: hypothetical protein V1735_03415 [Nanoarchaeota archaeon]
MIHIDKFGLTVIQYNKFGLKNEKEYLRICKNPLQESDVTYTYYFDNVNIKNSGDFFTSVHTVLNDLASSEKDEYFWFDDGGEHFLYIQVSGSNVRIFVNNDNQHSELGVTTSRNGNNMKYCAEFIMEKNIFYLQLILAFNSILKRFELPLKEQILNSKEHQHFLQYILKKRAICKELLVKYKHVL